MSGWVGKMILTGKTQLIRTKITERFIDIATEAFKINSLNVVMSILSAFDSSSLHRIRTLWEVKLGGISNIYYEKLIKLKNILKVDKNMTNYREFFKSLPAPKIPFLG